MYSAESALDDRIRAKFEILLDGYRNKFDQTFSHVNPKIW